MRRPCNWRAGRPDGWRCCHLTSKVLCRPLLRPFHPPHPPSRPAALPWRLPCSRPWACLRPTMQSWIALLPAASPEHGGLDSLHLGWWALQFTPRVALLEEAVVLEVQASERLFGGAAQLWQRGCRQAHGLGARSAAQAGTAHAALALVRDRQGLGPDMLLNVPMSTQLCTQLAPLP